MGYYTITRGYIHTPIVNRFNQQQPEDKMSHQMGQMDGLTMIWLLFCSSTNLVGSYNGSLKPWVLNFNTSYNKIDEFLDDLEVHSF